MNIRRIIDTDTAKSHMNDIVGTMAYLYENNKRLYNDNKELKSEHYKDEELIRLSKQVEELKEKLCTANKLNAFTLTEEEKKRIEEWQNKHNDEKHPDRYFGAAGGELTYSFTPTGIGMFGTVRCVCGEEFDFRKP